VLYTDQAINYEQVDTTDTTSQTAFFDLSMTKRQQLARSYQELIAYVPWTGNPDNIS